MAFRESQLTIKPPIISSPSPSPSQQPTNSKTSPFLALPLEIRNTIYTIVINTSQTIDLQCEESALQAILPLQAGLSRSGTLSALFLASRQTSIEIMAWYETQRKVQPEIVLDPVFGIVNMKRTSIAFRCESAESAEPCAWASIVEVMRDEDVQYLKEAREERGPHLAVCGSRARRYAVYTGRDWEGCWIYTD